MSLFQEVVFAWIAGMSLAAFVLFAWDKWKARRGGRRISEWALIVLGALGGWPGGAAAMLLFRHKTAKTSFKIKYVAALIVLILLAAGVAGVYRAVN